MSVYLSVCGVSVKATISMFENEHQENDEQISVTITGPSDIMRDASIFYHACVVVHDMLSAPLEDIMKGGRTL